MTPAPTAPLPAGIVAPRSAWRSLLWIVPLTAAWIAVIYWQPIVPTSGVQTTTHQLLAHAAIAIGMWLGVERCDLAPGQRRATWFAVMIPYTLWFAIAWSAAIHGTFRADESPSSLPLLPLAIILPVLIGTPILLLSNRLGQVLDAMPANWLVALQIYRIFGGWALAAWLHGGLPVRSRYPRESGMSSPAYWRCRQPSPWQAERPRADGQRCFGTSSGLPISPSPSRWG